jgi:hypothetical protein
MEKIITHPTQARLWSCDIDAMAALRRPEKDSVSLEVYNMPLKLVLTVSLRFHSLCVRIDDQPPAYACKIRSPSHVLQHLVEPSSCYLFMMLI